MTSPNRQPLATPAGSPVILARDLARLYPSRGGDSPGVRGASFAVLPGQLVLITGASGSGKTTLLSLLAGLDTPTDGELTVCGHDLRRASRAVLTQFRRHVVGMVFQSFNLMPTMTALENACLPAMIQQRDPVQTEAEASELLREVGLGDRLHHKPGELSGGEQQRVSVARALMQRPDLVLADEPTGNLDTHTGDALFSLLRQLNRSRSTTFVIVTHNDKLSAQADRIIHMQDGMIV